MRPTQCPFPLELFEVGRQQVIVTFDGGDVVSDAGLLPIRQVDQILARYPDGNDAQLLRDDLLFKPHVGLDPRE